jgi:hypothetical protein
MRVFLTIILALSAGIIEADQVCDLSSDGLNLYEQRILTHSHELKTTEGAAKIAEPLRCMFEIQKRGEGVTRYFAQSFLRPMLGGPQTPGVPKDTRYKDVAAFLEKFTLQSEDAANRSVVTEYAKGDWGFYVLFCEQGDTSFCTDFLPDENQVKADPPLLAAASILRLRKAYQVLRGKDRETVAKKIKTLYREIPRHDHLQRKFIDQIYNELFPTAIPLSMA